ncbi:MAG: hypothetical protein LBB90_11275, partial [Tannerella sp.]|nr:hypothetical protein [Tannerella sp.]
ASFCEKHGKPVLFRILDGKMYITGKRVCVVYPSGYSMHIRAGITYILPAIWMIKQYGGILMRLPWSPPEIVYFCRENT